LSLEAIIKALIDLGLSRSDAELYVYLEKKGPQKALDLAKALNINKPKIYDSLRNLQTKGLVTKVHTIFSALPFEEALNLLINMKKDQAQTMHEDKEELLTTWETKDY
jgi:sugar-specific transcriptional regulator TrmB